MTWFPAGHPIPEDIDPPDPDYERDRQLDDWDDPNPLDD